MAPRQTKLEDIGRKPNLVATVNNIFAVYLTLEPSKRTKENVYNAVHEQYNTNLTLKDIDRWMKDSNWKIRAEDYDKKTMNAIAETVSEQKQYIILPLMEQMLTAEGMGWAKLVRAIEEMPQELLSNDVKAFKGFADTLLNISKLRIVQEGGVTDRVGHEIRNMSDEELLKEIDTLTSKLNGEEIQEDVYDLEADMASLVGEEE